MPQFPSISQLTSPRLMGVVNVTPNSFSDGGNFLDPESAATHARLLVSQGATLLDLGAEASSFFRKGVEPVPPDEQLRRLLPVLHLLNPTSLQAAGILISVDTRSSIVAREVLKTGVAIINDISAGVHDPAILETVSATDASIILMHTCSHYPATATTDDPDLLATVRAELLPQIVAAERAGISRRRIALDPGVGFGKTMADNWRLAIRAREIADDLPIVLGVSRKRFLETPAPADVTLPADWEQRVAALAGRATHPRDATTAALTAYAATRGVPIHRVHDVALAVAALKR